MVSVDVKPKVSFSSPPPHTPLYSCGSAWWWIQYLVLLKLMVLSHPHPSLVLKADVNIKETMAMEQCTPSLIVRLTFCPKKTGYCWLLFFLFISSFMWNNFLCCLNMARFAAKCACCFLLWFFFLNFGRETLAVNLVLKFWLFLDANNTQKVWKRTTCLPHTVEDWDKKIRGLGLLEYWLAVSNSVHIQGWNE